MFGECQEPFSAVFFLYDYNVVTEGTTRLFLYINPTEIKNGQMIRCVAHELKKNVRFLVSVPRVVKTIQSLRWI